MGSEMCIRDSRTFISQIVAERLEVGLDDVEFESGDTAKFAHGVGTIGSRIAANAGPSAYDAATEVREKAISLASETLEVSEQDLELSNGKVQVKGVENLSISLGDLARALSPWRAVKFPPGFLPAWKRPHTLGQMAVRLRAARM